MTDSPSVLQARLEDLVRGVRVRGIAGPDEVVVDSVTWHGSNAVTVTLRDAAGIDDEVLGWIRRAYDAAG